jgi:hypothetical protein
MLIAMLILTFGLLAAGQLIYAALGSASLARSKSSATVVAQSKLDFLADLYRQNPAAADLTDGSHGPEQVDVSNPNSSTPLNRYNVSWTVGAVPDPRGIVLKAKRVAVTATPIGAGTTVNTKTSLNKVVTVTSIFSVRVQ